MSIQTISKPANSKPNLRDFKRFVYSFKGRNLSSEPISGAERAKIESSISKVRLCPHGSTGAIFDYRLNDPLLQAKLSDKWGIGRYALQVSHRFENKMLVGIFKSTIFGIAATSVAPMFHSLNTASQLSNAAFIGLGLAGAFSLINAVVGLISLERLNKAWQNISSEYTKPGFLKERLEAAIGNSS